MKYEVGQTDRWRCLMSPGHVPFMIETHNNEQCVN
jgi:hypothetical protein